MRSMTGFGRASIQNTPYTIEISGVNRKQFELKIVLPKALNFYECEMRSILAASLSRGSIYVRIELSNSVNGETEVTINEPLLIKLYTQLQSIARKVDASIPPSWGDLLQLPDMVIEENVFEKIRDVKTVLISTLEQAIFSFIASKEKEGEALKVDFQTRVALLNSYLFEVESLVKNIPAQIEARFREKMNELQAIVPFEAERVAKEIFFFVQRADVSEELTRLKSHLSCMNQLIETPLSGRNMEFQIQEIQREITTLGNKTGTVDISPWVVKFKTEVERMKEQVQNVE